MVNDLTWLENFRKYKKSRQVRLGGSKTLLATGAGIACLSIRVGDKIRSLRLSDVQYVPGLRRNLISVGVLVDEGHRVEFQTELMLISLRNETVVAERMNGLFVLKAEPPAEVNVANATSNKRISLKTAHSIFAHINVDTLRQMLVREGYERNDDFISCEPCTQGKNAPCKS